MQQTTTTISSTTTTANNKSRHHQLHPLPRAELVCRAKRKTNHQQRKIVYPRESHERTICARQVLLLLLLVRSALSRSLSLSLSVRACAEHETQSTQPTQPARAAIKAEVTGDESNILNATVVKYTPRSQLRTFVHLLDDATNNKSSTWHPNTNSPKPTNTAK